MVDFHTHTHAQDTQLLNKRQVTNTMNARIEGCGFFKTKTTTYKRTYVSLPPVTLSIFFTRKPSFPKSSTASHSHTGVSSRSCKAEF